MSSIIVGKLVSNNVEYIPKHWARAVLRGVKVRCTTNRPTRLVHRQTYYVWMNLASTIRIIVAVPIL